MSKAGKVITTRVGYKYRRVSRWIKLHPYASGEDYYFRWHRLRLRLSDVLRITYPIFFEDDDGKDAFLSGYYPFCNTCCLLIEMDYNGAGYVRIYEEIDGGDN